MTFGPCDTVSSQDNEQASSKFLLPLGCTAVLRSETHHFTHSGPSEDLELFSGCPYP